MIFPSCIHRCLYSCLWFPTTAILVQAVYHHKSPSLWCEVCDTFAHSQADFKVTISVLIDFPFYVWYNCRYTGLFDYIQIYWATWFYAILWMIIGKPITCIIHTQHAHHFMAYIPYISTSKLMMFFRSVLTNLLVVLMKPLGWVLYSFHTRRTLENYPSFILFIFYYLSDSYIDTFIVLLLKIREGVVLRTSPTYYTYIHNLPVSSKVPVSSYISFIYILYPSLSPLVPRCTHR